MDEAHSSKAYSSKTDEPAPFPLPAASKNALPALTIRPSMRLGLKQLINAGWRQTLDFLYPPTCPLCMKETAQHDALCAKCWGGLNFIERPFCERLGLPFSVDLGGVMLSPEAIAHPPDFQRARAAVRYDDDARKLTHRLKYNDRIELSRLMAHMMARAGRELLTDAALILPVPLHYGRLWSRRFNQSAVLSAHISRFSDIPWDPYVLERRKRTRPQVGLTRSERSNNLQGAFHIPKKRRHLIAGQNVLLIDDVLTTGATANACARALLRAGAKSVDVLVFARVVIGN